MYLIKQQNREHKRMIIDFRILYSFNHVLNISTCINPQAYVNTTDRVHSFVSNLRNVNIRILFSKGITMAWYETLKKVTLWFRTRSNKVKALLTFNERFSSPLAIFHCFLCRILKLFQGEILSLLVISKTCAYI